MGKYGDIIYGGATYGATPKLTYSVEPMSTDVIKYREAYVYFQSPAGTFSRIRLVRNQYGFPETAEDGVIIWEQNSADGSSLEGTLNLTNVAGRGLEFKDGEDNPYSTPIVPGRNIYYRVFLYTSDNLWIVAGSTRDVIPAFTGVIDKLINVLPRVYTSEELSPLGTVSPNSILYQFLDGFAFTYEQFLTQLALLRPIGILEKSNYTTIPGEFLNVGLSPEPTVSVLNQRRLIREALYLYSLKGTELGIKNYAESLTGYSPSVTISPNLMLTVQDSTFYNATGNWVATNATLSTTDEMVPPTTVTNAIDQVYTCKIVASDAGYMTLGFDFPVTKGIPITPGNHYTYSFQIKSPASSGTVTPSITFYDKDDGATYTSSGSGVAANNTWKLSTQTVNADEGEIGNASYAGLKISWSAAGTYYVDMVCFQTGTSVSYDEARALTLNLNPIKTNYIENPSFEIDATGWDLTNLTFSLNSSNYPKEGYPSLHSGQFVAGSGTWQLSNTSEIPVDPGTFFNVSMYAYSLDIPNMNMYIDVYDSSDTLITSISDTHTMTSTWARKYVRGLIDANLVADHAYVRFTGTGPGTFNLDMIQAEDTYNPTDYFDGSMPVNEGVVWQGTANNSISLSYPGKTTKIPRLSDTMVDWVPMNMWWRITTPAGLEYTNLSV